MLNLYAEKYRSRKEKRQVVVLSLFISYSSFSFRHLMFAGLDFELLPLFLPPRIHTQSIILWMCRCIIIYPNLLHIIILRFVSFTISFAFFSVLMLHAFWCTADDRVAETQKKCVNTFVFRRLFCFFSSLMLYEQNYENAYISSWVSEPMCIANATTIHRQQPACRQRWAALNKI